jgi:DNA-binding transcriptional ArsR family regulator
VQHIWPPRPEIDSVADAAAAEGNLVMTPAWFGGQIHVLEFDGKVYVGRGIRHEGPSLKQVADEVSSRIKSLSDPTRLAIFLCLASEPASVTEIARKLNLSQPTVSAHVQMLREAGLLDEKTVGRSAQLSASAEGMHKLFSNAEEALGRAFRP